MNEAVDASTEGLFVKTLVDTVNILFVASFTHFPTTISALHTQTFLNEAVDASTEGLIVKTLVDTYEPSKRSSHWLKVCYWHAWCKCNVHKTKGDSF